MKVNTKLLRETGSDFEKHGIRVAELNEELVTSIAAISLFDGIEVNGKLKKISIDLQASATAMSKLAETLGTIAEIYEHTEETVIEKRGNSYSRYVVIRPHTEIYIKPKLTYADVQAGHPAHSLITSMIERFF